MADFRSMDVERTLLIPAEQAGMRLDQAAAQLWPDFSRSRIQEWIKGGQVTVDGRSMRPRDTVLGGEELSLRTELEQQSEDRPQDIPLDIVFEDEHLLVVNKPVDLVVHPGAGNPDGTLVNALLHHDPELALLPRAGVVHRLDKQTSGLLVVGKTQAAFQALVADLAERRIGREYDAVVIGHLIAGGTVDEPIGRHARDRQRQAVVAQGKPAVTHYRVVEQFGEHTWLRVKLETGRTHQIRVHMAHIRHPIVGDPVYGGRPRLPRGAEDMLVDVLRDFGRQALHARRLTLTHPETGETLSLKAPMPDDMDELIELLRDYRDGNDEGEAEVIYVTDPD
ncbi:23S rRNA pseudouridine(1911/1915/1917) synthase RluD [Guyparkeria sp. TX1]|uniref:23S rRNA pseudouridine(1911/1915/1917) synthase RluD n=1 Tax=Guyparkeria sp. TX1 TaxID=3115001 RepID=UPI003977CAAE